MSQPLAVPAGIVVPRLSFGANDLMGVRHTYPIAAVVPALIGAYCAAMGPAAAEARLDGTGTRPSLAITGVIAAMEHCKVAVLLADHPEIHQVQVDSPGGDAWAGAQLARLFGWADLEAVVPKGASALSAAGIAVLGAPHRRIDGYLGLHRPYLPRTAAVSFGRAIIDEVIVEEVTVLRESGVSDRTIAIAMDTQASNLFLTIDQKTVNGFHHHGRPDRERIFRIAQACKTSRS